MSELTSNQYLIIIAVLLFISIVMLFLLSRSKRDTQELQQDLNKTIEDYNQLAERFDSLSAVNFSCVFCCSCSFRSTFSCACCN